MIDLNELLTRLNATKLVKVTGSFADGTQTESSDIDFYVKEDKPDATERNMSKVYGILKDFGLNLDSSMTGYLYTHKSDNDIPIELEFSDLFNHRPNRLKTVTIEGVEFKTW